LDLALAAAAKAFPADLDAGRKYELALFAAEICLQQRQPDKARQWLEKVKPSADERWRQVMIRADYAAGDYRASTERLLLVRDRDAAANLLLGMAFQQRQIPGPALEFLGQIEDPRVLTPAEQLSLFGNRAYLNFDQGQHQAALTDAEKALALAPSTEMALVRLRLLALVGTNAAFEQAAQALLNPGERGLKLTATEQAQVLLIMGRQDYRQEKYDAAIRRLTDAVQRDPALAEAYYLRGLAQHALGKSAEALTNYQAYVRLEPHLPATFWGDLGQAEGSRRNYKQGTAALGRSLDYHSVDVATLSDLGYQFMKWSFPNQATNHALLVRWNHNREAKQAFRRAADLYADLVPRVPTNETAAYREREVAMKKEYTKLDRLIGFQAYISRTDYGFPTNVGISSVDGALPSQGGLELSLRPPVVGFLNERTLEVFGNISGNFQRQSWTPDPDSYQGMVGLRLKPFIGFNYNMSFARLFKIGDNSENNWLWRNLASWERGEKPAPDETVALNLKLFGDLGYYFEPRTRWYGYLDGRAGPSWRLHQSVLLTLPQAMGILRYETNDESDTGSYGLAGIGGTLRLFEPEGRHTINRCYADFFAYYTWGQFMSTPAGFDGRAFDGPMFGINLVK
jgi:tetratricopeptide (TPR) repeat protein